MRWRGERGDGDAFGGVAVVGCRLQKPTEKRYVKSLGLVRLKGKGWVGRGRWHT
jgi:hypothetical protein